MGAKASDHGLLEPYGLEVSEERAEQFLEELMMVGKGLL